MPNIVITKRSDDFHAALEGNPAIWSASRVSADEAIGNLMRTHPEHFGVHIRWNEENEWTRRYLAHDPLTRN